MLSTAEVEAFRHDGILVPRYRLEPEVLARLRALSDKLIDDNAHLGDQPIACPHVPGSGVQDMKSDPGWIELPTHAPILDMVEQLIGPDVICWGSTFFHKPARKGGVIPFHRDGRYWPIKPLATLSVWIAVEDADVDNGCLRAVPGSHQAREVGRHYSSTRPEDTIPETLYADEFDEVEARDIELEAGQMALFGVFTIHGSNANTSARRRIGYAIRYMPATSHYDHDAAHLRDSPGGAHQTRPLMLLRGVDKSGRNDFTIGHP